MNKARLVLRADGNAQIGLGHVVRTLALADMVRTEFSSCLFAIREPVPAAIQLVEEAGIEIVNVPPLSTAEEAAWLVTNLLLPTDLLVLDGYAFATSYQERVRCSGCLLAIVDDLHAWSTPADLIINHAPGVSPENYLATPHARFCLGPNYSLLRTPFLQHAKLPHPVTQIASATICFGGADPQQLTLRCLEALHGSPEITRLSVVVGGAFGHLPALRHLAKHPATPSITIHQGIPAPEMVDLLQAHDVVICPASTVLIETLVLGCASVTGYYVENQRHLANSVHENQQAYSVGNFLHLGPEQLQKQIQEGIRQHLKTLRRPYAANLNTEMLRHEFRRLASRAGSSQQ